MKWFFFALCTLNVVILVLQWSDARDLGKHERYVKPEQVRELRMMGSVAKLSSDADRQCTLIGPFQNLDSLQGLRDGFGAISVQTDVISQMMELAPAYWVYFSSFEEGRDAQSYLKEIKANGLDAFIIATGELKGNISLGVFKNIDSARRMIKIANKKGYETSLTEIKRAEDVNWLSVFLPYSIENKGKIQGILDENKLESEMRDFFCKSVASEK